MILWEDVLTACFVVESFAERNFLPEISEVLWKCLLHWGAHFSSDGGRWLRWSKACFTELLLPALRVKKQGCQSLLSSGSEVSSLRSDGLVLYSSTLTPSLGFLLCCLYNLLRITIFKNLLSAFLTTYFSRPHRQRCAICQKISIR